MVTVVITVAYFSGYLGSTTYLVVFGSGTNKLFLFFTPINFKMLVLTFYLFIS